MTESAKTYNYVVSAQRETVVTHSVSASFVSEDSFDIICAKGSRLEVRTLKDNESLDLVCTVPMFGYINSIKVIRPMQDQQQKDWIFVLTDRPRFFILAYENGKVIEEINWLKFDVSILDWLEW